MASLGSPRHATDDRRPNRHACESEAPRLSTIRRRLFAGRSPSLGYTSGDGVRQQFTQYERDIEIGLDYAKARYFSYLQGRFTSPDPLPASGKAAIPQSWNRYSYVLNNPLKFIDPSGMIWVYHYLDKDRNRIGIAWIEGNKVSKDLAAKGYKAFDFAGAKRKTLSLPMAVSHE